MGRCATGAGLFWWATAVCAQAPAPVDPPEGTPATIPVEAPADVPSSPDQAEPVVKPGSRLVGEIIVTAQKREENLQDVPISVQAFTADTLDAHGITNPSELGQVTPSLTFSENVGFAVVYMRGVGSDVFLLGDPSVAYYTDNVYLPLSQGLAQQFGSIERIEVLKGPQGTLFGRNAIGGAINIITRAPQFDAVHVSYQSNVGDFDTLENRVSVNLPLADTFAVGVSAFYNTNRYHQGGLVAGETPDDQKARAMRVRLRWRPIDDLDMSLSVLRYLSDTQTGGIFQLNQHPSPLALAVGVRPQTGYDGELDSPIYQIIRNRMVYGDGKWSAPWFDLKVMGSDQFIRTGALYDFDGSPVPVAAFNGPRLIADVQTGEVQLLSNRDSWGSDWLQWTGGWYYFKSLAGYDTGVRAVVSGVEQIRNAILALDPGLTDIQILGGVLDNVPNGHAVLYGELATKSYAFYSQATAYATDWLSFTLGARYQHEQRRVAESGMAIEQADLDPVLLPDIYGSVGRHDTTKSFRPKISVELHPSDDDLVYLSYQEAEKSATFTAVKIAQPLDHIRPETTKAWELGAKTRLFDGLMTLSSAVFHYDIEDLQVQYVSITSGGALTFENAPRTKVWGFDFDTTVALFPDLFDAFALTLGGAYVHGRYTEYPNGAGFDEQTGLFSKSSDFSGNTVVRTPKISLTSTLSKAWNAPGGSIEAAVDAYYSDGFFYTAQNSDVARQDPYTILGARLSYLYEPWALRVTAWGKNLTDKYYSSGILQADFGTNVSLAPPLMYGLRLNWDF